MAKPENKARGEEALPELGVKMRLTIDALERIESQFTDADHWLATVSTELRKPSPKVIRLCIEAGVDGDVDFETVGQPGKPTWVDLGNHVVDALFLSIYGMTFDQRVEYEADQEVEETKKKLERLKRHPDLIEALSSNAFADPVTGPASAPPTPGT